MRRKSVMMNHEKLIVNRINSFTEESKHESLHSRENFTANVNQISLSCIDECNRVRNNNKNANLEQVNNPEGDIEENKNVREETNRYTKVSGSHKCTRKNIVMASIFIILATTGVILVTVFFDEIKGYADEYSDFMKTDPELAVFFFMIAFTSSTPFCIPATFFILLGSFIFGRTFGFLHGFIIFTLVDYICQMVGVFLAFLNGRYLFRKCVQNCIQRKPKLLAISEALTHNAKKLVFLLRLSNLTPYDMLNYLCSVTNMSALDYIIGNTSIILCDAPFIYVCVSITDLSNLDNASQGLGDWYYVLLSFGIFLAFIVVVFVFIYTKRELKKMMGKIEREKDAANQSHLEQEIEEAKLPEPMNENQMFRSYDQHELNNFVMSIKN